MSEVTITVRGSHEDRIPAELAIAEVAVRLDGPDRASVLADAVAIAQRLKDELSAAQTAGAVARWSSDRVSVWSNRPWSNDGAQLPLVHHASIGTRSEFTDFSALSEWIAAVSEREGVVVDGVRWELTPATARATEAAVAQGAVSVAVERARAYASALDLHTVRAVEIADTGLLRTSDAPERAAAPMMMARSASAGSATPALELEPRPITVSATVEARFAAS